jgi:hypothetical protein
MATAFGEYLRIGAGQLSGSTRERRAWTVLEEQQLREMMELGIRVPFVPFIARSLQRTVPSVTAKAVALGLSLVWRYEVHPVGEPDS